MEFVRVAQPAYEPDNCKTEFLQSTYDPEIDQIVYPSVEVTQPQMSNYTWYYIKGYFAYIIACIPLAYGATFIGEVDTQSEWYAAFYERNSYYTTYFSFGKLFYWLALAAIGFTFVVVVNLGNYRKDPFTSRDGSYKDIKILIPLAFVLYFVSAQMFLRDKHDMQRNCPVVNQDFVNYAYDQGIIRNRLESEDINNFTSDPENYKTLAESDMSMGDLINTVLDLFIDQTANAQHCHIYSRSEVFWYNYFYLIVYFIGLNFTHLDQPPFNQITLEWDVMKNWPWFLWVIFLGIISFIFMNFAYLLLLYSQSGVLTEYILLLLAMPTFFIVGTYYYASTRKLHVHHYCLGCMVVMMTGYQSTYVSALAAIFTGIMVEGAARWGFDPIWVPK